MGEAHFVAEPSILGRGYMILIIIAPERHHSRAETQDRFDIDGLRFGSVFNGREAIITGNRTGIARGMNPGIT